MATGTKVADMLLSLLMIFAEGEGKPAAPQGGLSDPMLPLLIMGIVLLFFMMVLRPAQKRREKEAKSLLTNTKKNDRILTTAGIYGTVISISDKEDEVIVKVDDNTRLKMLKSSIHRNLTAEENVKAEADKAKEAKSDAIRKG